MFKDITIKEKSQGQRLDKFLAEVLTGKTRSQIQKLVKSGQVLVNGRPAKVHRFLKTGEVISFVENGQEQGISKKTDAPFPYQPTDLPTYQPKILHETLDFLVLEKPAGLLVHATDKGETDTLVDWLKDKYPEIENVGEENYRAGIIHRLDKDVSGVMVAAKTNPAFFHLKEQFKERKVKKEYLALVYGKIGKPEGEITLPIGRGKSGQFVAHPRFGEDKYQDADKFAKTEYKVLEYIKDYTFLSVKILTGRTHQIRAHLSAIGHPILGDAIYRPKKNFLHFFSKRVKVVDLPRLFLHSAKIGFYGLNNQWREFESPLPDELKKILEEKRK
ncbi:MAG: hypothetical protein A3H67_01670 [Candidatus Buchananbacteria bacterium RIFCSPLOWO2_02_FULL_46_11b]|uniref:Pseudouridine synthase n=1 Tax=Candidatus Buchananbacteria bacterium RIFCSPLOWO2_02_FULL_46_11b TaxID=1797548 RepID=A0A1G1Z085_9BACT|nr:MAG: hypothetical protein A3H67_01670 [Candidatus Buchananbacteria bacterium RIFCSPLOWO2_02_FULL_46_11b]